MTQQQAPALAIFEKTSPEDLAKLPAQIAEGSILNNPQALAHLGNVARFFAYSELVPTHYQGKPHEIFIALESARNLGVDPMVYLQGTTVIHGRQGMFASLINSLLKRSGVLIGAVRYEEEETGEIAFGTVKDIRIRAYGKEKETGEILHGPWVSLAMAKAEGWTKNSKYTSMPNIMLEKRALTFFCRRFFPEVLNGMHEVGEIEDMNFTPSPDNAPPIVSPLEVEAPATPAEPVSRPEEKPKAETPAEPKKPKTGSKAWFVQELKKEGATFIENDSLANLKKLYGDLQKKRKQAEEAEPAEVIPEANLETAQEETPPPQIEDPLETPPPVDEDAGEEYEEDDFDNIFGED